MTDLDAAEVQWHEWIGEACAAVDVDASSVDVPGIHTLTRQIAHGFERPMAPVASYILGVAVGQLMARGEDIDQEPLRRAIAATALPNASEDL